MKSHFDAIAITCQFYKEAEQYQNELELYQRCGLIHKDSVLLAIEDPASPLGSGGATINALLIIYEHLSSKIGLNILDADKFEDIHILIIHMGRWYACDFAGRAALNLPLSLHGSASCPVTNLVSILSFASKQGKPGLWIVSSDAVLVTDFISLCPEGNAVVYTIPCDIDYAALHGAILSDSQGFVDNIFYQHSIPKLKETFSTSKIPVISGVVFFDLSTTRKLLDLHLDPALMGCTYLGLDSGASPIVVSLFFDILHSMCGDVTESTFLESHSVPLQGAAAVNARTALWKHFNKTRLKMSNLDDLSYNYLFNAPSHLKFIDRNIISSGNVLKPFHVDEVSFSVLEGEISSDCIILNSICHKESTVSKGCRISNSIIPSGLVVPNNCYLNGIKQGEALGKMSLQPNTVYHEVCVESTSMLVIYGMLDDVDAVSSIGTFLGRTWDQYGIVEEDLWDAEVPKTLAHAKLFPFCATLADAAAEMRWMLDACRPSESWREMCRFSMSDIFRKANLVLEFGHRWGITLQYALSHVSSVLLENQALCLLPIYRLCVADGRTKQLLLQLDSLARRCVAESKIGHISRIFAGIADVLAIMAYSRGGLRSGPANHWRWRKVFAELEAGKICESIALMSELREQWMSSPTHLIRVARHYEGAAQILIRMAVGGVRKLIHLTPCGRPAVDQWVRAEGCARLDLGGGWSDTPPITYEHGGAVCNVAILVNGKRPIGARAKRISELKVEVWLEQPGPKLHKLELTSTGDLRNYCQPNTPGALVKSALLTAGIVSLTSELPESLFSSMGSGVAIQTWSSLPQGSGLGTSSILAGTVIALLWKLSGKQYSTDCLNYAVLALEQLMTTGGGWQDQVGGLTGGFKLATSAPSLPIQISVRTLAVDDSLLQKFSNHFLLIYTGKTRLAKNLLQNVLREWAARDEGIVSIQDDLVKCAHQVAESITLGNLAQVGMQMDRYWQLKKRMAPGSEPDVVKRIRDVLAPFVHASLLAGAGGGGFLIALTKEPAHPNEIKKLLDEKELDCCLYDCEIASEGVIIEMENEN